MEATSASGAKAGTSRPARLDRASDVRHEFPDRQKPHDTRTEFERDRSRILHARSFRLLQAKTQVFYGVAGASFRTRLTHSMEVALIAKALALKLGADPDLCETAALAHDLGHPPFGHNGEAVLDELLAGHGGFEANAQTLRIVRRLEAKGHRYLGLNLTFATLDGILKYKEPVSVARARAAEAAALASPGGAGPGSVGRAAAGGPPATPWGRPLSDDARDLLPATPPPKCVYDDDVDLVREVGEARGTGAAASFECRILELADDFAYCVADLQDGLAMSFLDVGSLRRAARGEPPLGEILGFLESPGDGWTEAEVAAHLGALVDLHDAIARKRRDRPLVGADEDFYAAATFKELASKLHRALVAAVGPGPDGSPTLEPEAGRRVAVLKAVTRTQVLGDPRLTTLDAASRKVVRRLFEAWANDPALLPRGVRAAVERAADDAARLRTVADHVAGLPDDAALQAYRRLYEPGSTGLLDFP